MPTLRPFPGIRFSAEDIGNLVCPPYDVISPEEQEELHGRSEHNAVRLELAKTGFGDDRPRYADVGDLFQRWVEEGVLRGDATDALYIYRQDFSTADGSRHRVAGVMGALELEEFGDDAGVLPHERTMSGPKEDRLALMRACPVNISPIYAIYRGGGELAPYLDSLENRPPQARFQDKSGILHRLWVVTAPAEKEMLSAAIAPGPLVIADGHHRYETALAFHREQEANGVAGDHGSIMCFCVDADAEDLVVLPYNRAVKSSIDTASVIERLTTRFAAKPVDQTDALDALAKDPADHPFLFAFEDRTFLARATDADVVAVTGDRHPAWRSLDVVALHEVVLPEILGGHEAEFRFSRDPEEIKALVQRGDFDLGVLLKALRASEVVDVASSGERMPQKASYFWPKAITGLVFHRLV
jgi:uncharacterized protein (DUF1015 family)